MKDWMINAIWYEIKTASSFDFADRGGIVVAVRV